MTQLPESDSESRATLQGTEYVLTPDTQDPSVIIQATDYRGDVTLYLADGEVIEGFVFDRRTEVQEPYCRIWPKDSDEKRVVPLSQITKVVFSGKDTAMGKSWESWLKKVQEKKAQGLTARMDPEPLDED